MDPKFTIGNFFKNPQKTLSRSSKEIWLSQGIYVYSCHNNNDNKGYASHRKN
jgi:hypothetical protein